MISRFVAVSCNLRFALLASVLLATSATRAQQFSPSLQDTTTWLRNIYLSHGTFDLNNGVRQTVTLSMNSCSAYMTIETTASASASNKNEVVQVDLGKLDPRATPHTNFEKTSAAMLVHTFDGAQSIRTVTTSPNASAKVEGRSEYNLLLPLGEYTLRASKAWSHAISLCGGRPSAF